jgi:hypothetical protein
MAVTLTSSRTRSSEALYGAILCAVAELRFQGEIVSDDLLAHVVPLGWEHNTFNGDYVWPREPLQNDFRSLAGSALSIPRSGLTCHARNLRKGELLEDKSHSLLLRSMRFRMAVACNNRGSHQLCLLCHLAVMSIKSIPTAGRISVKPCPPPVVN